MKFEKEFHKMKEVWGEEAQILVAIEECSELAQALVKYIRASREYHGKDPEKLAKAIKQVKEEAADVLNCVEQIEEMFGYDEIEKIRGEKVERTMKIIEKLKQGGK